MLLGYCLGGLLACALAAARQHDLAGLALLATPWDFHAGGSRERRCSRPICFPLTLSIATLGCAPVDLLQTFFALLDPLGVIAQVSSASPSLPHGGPTGAPFVAVEDWLNDGVPLAGPVAQECLWHWYVAEPARPRACGRRAAWRCGRRRLDLPAFVAIPRHDRIVPRRPPPTASGVDPAAGDASCGPRRGMSACWSASMRPSQLWQPAHGMAAANRA